MSEDDFGVYLNRRGNLVRKIWSSANCTGATDWIEVNPENTANGNCFNNPQPPVGSALLSWTGTK